MSLLLASVNARQVKPSNRLAPRPRKTKPVSETPQMQSKKSVKVISIKQNAKKKQSVKTII